MKNHFNLVLIVFLFCFIFSEVPQLKAQNSMNPHPIKPLTKAPSIAAAPRHALSDSVQVAWVSYYASGLAPPSDIGWAIAVDESGNVYVTGGSGWGSYFVYNTMKYDSTGVEQWVARYNGPANGWDVAIALAVDDAGNVYVTGESEGSGTDRDYATVKYDSAGIEQWVARYNGPVNSSDGAIALAVDDAGNVYVTGESEGSGTSIDYTTVKYNSAGVEQWVARYNGPANEWDEAADLAVDETGNVYVTGESKGSGTCRD
jgi:hypothetical protein